MNKEKQQINKAVKKAMGKLVAFSLTDLVEENGGMQSQLMGAFNSVWVNTYALSGVVGDILMIDCPGSTKEIGDFDQKIESLMANIKRELLSENGE